MREEIVCGECGKKKYKNTCNQCKKVLQVVGTRLYVDRHFIEEHAEEVELPVENVLVLHDDLDFCDEHCLAQYFSNPTNWYKKE